MHAAPLGSARHFAALRHADEQVARVAEAVERLRDAGHDVLFLVGSDHGHESVTEVIPVERRLFEAGFKRELDGPEIIVAPQGSAAFIHFGGAALDRIDEAAAWLAEQSWVGAVFRGPDLPALGQIPGDDVIAIDLTKTEGSNINGVPGLTAMAVRFSETEDDVRRDCGMHGGRGERETNPTLIAVGSRFEAGRTISDRSSITDITPTALVHLGLDWAGLDGHPLQASV
jgi:arylsulfatase A-like enzyme